MNWKDHSDAKRLMGELLEIALDVALKKHLTFNPTASMAPETKNSSFGLLTPLLMSLSTKSFFITSFTSGK